MSTPNRFTDTDGLDHKDLTEDEKKRLEKLRAEHEKEETEAPTE